MIKAYEIKNIARIEEVVSHFGTSLNHENQGLCPFHDDSNPSMKIYPETNSFNCFACDTGGSVIDFVMKKKQIDFKEAISYLAELYHVTEEKTPQEGSRKAKSINKPIRKESALIIEAKAEAIKQNIPVYQSFFRMLSLTEKGSQYLNARQITDQTLEKFQVMSIDNSNKVFLQLKKLFSIEELKAAGFITKKGGFIFWQPAIIFPVFNPEGDPIYFTSRNLKGDIKSFKLSGVKQHYFTGNIKDSDSIYLFEGILDALSYSELTGKESFIALNGLVNIKKYDKFLSLHPDKKLILAFDDDKAGRTAQKIIEEDRKVNALNWFDFYSLTGVTTPCKDMNDVLISYRQMQRESKISGTAVKEKVEKSIAATDTSGGGQEIDDIQPETYRGGLMKKDCKNCGYRKICGGADDDNAVCFDIADEKKKAMDTENQRNQRR